MVNFKKYLIVSVLLLSSVNVTHTMDDEPAAAEQPAAANPAEPAAANPAEPAAAKPSKTFIVYFARFFQRNTTDAVATRVPAVAGTGTDVAAEQPAVEPAAANPAEPAAANPAEQPAAAIKAPYTKGIFSWLIGKKSTVAAEMTEQEIAIAMRDGIEAIEEGKNPLREEKIREIRVLREAAKQAQEAAQEAAEEANEKIKNACILNGNYVEVTSSLTEKPGFIKVTSTNNKTSTWHQVNINANKKAVYWSAAAVGVLYIGLWTRGYVLHNNFMPGQTWVNNLFEGSVQRIANLSPKMSFVNNLLRAQIVTVAKAAPTIEVMQTTAKSWVPSLLANALLKQTTQVFSASAA